MFRSRGDHLEPPEEVEERQEVARQARLDRFIRRAERMAPITPGAAGLQDMDRFYANQEDYR